MKCAAPLCESNMMDGSDQPTTDKGEHLISHGKQLARRYIARPQLRLFTKSALQNLTFTVHP